MRTLGVLTAAAALFVSASTARAQDPEYQKLTYLTFSAPVQLPGIALPAGTYRFELANPDTERRVVRVASQDGKQQYGLLLSIPNEQLRRTDAKQPLILFNEAPAGSPQAVRAWFYATDSTGYEFVYPREEAVKIARTVHQHVRSMDT